MAWRGKPLRSRLEKRTENRQAVPNVSPDCCINDAGHSLPNRCRSSYGVANRANLPPNPNVTTRPGWFSPLGPPFPSRLAALAARPCDTATPGAGRRPAPGTNPGGHRLLSPGVVGAYYAGRSNHRKRNAASGLMGVTRRAGLWYDWRCPRSSVDRVLASGARDRSSSLRGGTCFDWGVGRETAGESGCGLVARRLLWEQEIGSSNLPTPTKQGCAAGFYTGQFSCVQPISQNACS